jgi:hypothetical protein
MQVTSYFGYICPNCKTTIDIGAMVGANKILCPTCKTEMVPNPQGRPVSTNVHCKKCNSSFGMINSDKCPTCGTPF